MFKFQQADPNNNWTDRNTCVPRALALATKADYDTVFLACKDAGRRYGRGMYYEQIDRALQTLTGDPCTKLVHAPVQGRYVGVSTRRSRYYGDTMTRWQSLAPTFAQFAASNPVGRFIVLRNGHAVALINGTFLDSAARTCGPRARVTAWCRVA